MDILVDSYTAKLPKDVTTFAGNLVDAGALDGASIRPLKGSAMRTPMAAAPAVATAAPPLDRWDVKTHTYKQKIAGELSILAKLFSGSAKKVKAGVVHEAKRYRLEKTDIGREVEIGVSVRLSVATASFEAKFDLSIPNLAAQAQLGLSEARIGISVVGFFGPVGDLLPAPEDLNVENFSVFTNAAKEIQKRVFGPDGVDFLAPTLLSYGETTAKKG